MLIKFVFTIILTVVGLFFAGCTLTSDSDRKFTGDPLELLILDIDLPSGWELWNLSHEPFAKSEDLVAVYKKPQEDAFGTNSVITHDVTVFNQLEDAKAALEADYQYELELVIDTAQRYGPYQENFEPPKHYAYRSPLADEYRVIYAAKRGLTGPVVGYRYTVWARYGNVISWFTTTVANEEETGIGPREANILPWSEVERLLMLIDQRFEEAGME